MWAIPLKNKYSKTITDEFSKVLTKAKRLPLKQESDRGAEFYNSIFQIFLKTEKIYHYSRFTDKGPSIVDRVIRTIRNLFRKPIFLAGEANWLIELPYVIRHYNNTIHNSSKMTPIQAGKKVNEKEVYQNLQDRRVKQKPKFKLGQLVRTVDNKRVFSKRDSTNYSYKFYKITEVIHETIPSYRIDYLPERYNENLLLPTKITLVEHNKVMKELNLIE